MTRARASVIIFSWTAGVMYSTLFTMPYLLVAHYHSESTVRQMLPSISLCPPSPSLSLSISSSPLSSPLSLFPSISLLSPLPPHLFSLNCNPWFLVIFQFEVDVDGEAKLGTQVRGLGTDVAIVSSMVFLAQFILSICMGSIVTWSGTTTAVVSVASFLAFCGALSATQIMYLDL